MITLPKRYLIDSSVYKKNIVFQSQWYDANTCVETPDWVMLKSDVHSDWVYEQLDKPYTFNPENTVNES